MWLLGVLLVPLALWLPFGGSQSSSLSVRIWTWLLVVLALLHALPTVYSGMFKLCGPNGPMHHSLPLDLPPTEFFPDLLTADPFVADSSHLAAPIDLVCCGLAALSGAFHLLQELAPDLQLQYRWISGVYMVSQAFGLAARGCLLAAQLPIDLGAEGSLVVTNHWAMLLAGAVALLMVLWSDSASSSSSSWMALSIGLSMRGPFTTCALYVLQMNYSCPGAQLAQAAMLWCPPPRPGRCETERLAAQVHAARFLGPLAPCDCCPPHQDSAARRWCGLYGSARAARRWLGSGNQSELAPVWARPVLAAPHY